MLGRVARPALSLVLLALVAAPAVARAWVLYDASRGTLPPAQGWTQREDISPPAPYVAEIDQGDLHLSTLGFASSGAQGGGVWWEHTDVALDFAQDFAVEASIRIDQAPDHSVNAQTQWPRPGYTVAVYDVDGHLFWIGLGSGEVFLSNTAYGQYGSGNTVTTAFNTTDAHHVYRLERAAGGTGASLRIDGVVRLTLPALGPVETTGGGLVYFGDPTYWANSESHTAWVRLSDAVLAVDPSRGVRRLWAEPQASPARRLALAVSAAESGTLSLEIFDAAGRRVERAEQAIAAGERRRFEPASGHADGLYFYRARLTPAAGNAAEIAGRIVLVR